MADAFALDEAASRLESISRTEQRERTLGGHEIKFLGEDVWRTSELTWLDHRGKPRRGDLTIRVDATSPNMVESKSLKLYLMSYAMATFMSRDEVEEAIHRHLAAAFGSNCEVAIDTTSAGFQFDSDWIEGSHRLDYIPLGVSTFEPTRDLLAPRRGANRASGRFHTDLFRCLCPKSGQPDYATIVISLENAWFSAESLLSYLVSYRTHQGFHESTVEKIFADLTAVCEPDGLTVLGSFARRGGLDISPFRSSTALSAPNWRSNIA